ncbi:MAG: ATP synthase F1 subunit gamma [Patescibacteria group bacterium]|nr:ATP synthase F1 subunit gamma [Patescibacteria group bacterium]
MAGMRDIKRRIKSVQGTRKITRAMQLVSAAKMRKAQYQAASSRPYSSLAWELINNLTRQLEIDMPLLRTHRHAKKVGVLLISTNRGFVGSLNVNLVGKLKELEKNPELICELIVHGQQAKTLTARMGKVIGADFPKLDKTAAIEDIYPIAKYLADLYQTNHYRKIYIVYNHFYSTISQKPEIVQLLPFNPEVVKQSKEKQEVVISKKYGYNYQFEPDPEKVLEHLLPRIIESQIYQAVLESDASEHSARMIMMKNATDAAGDLIDDLTLSYNQLRQNKITTELAEITAGKIALE